MASSAVAGGFTVGTGLVLLAFGYLIGVRGWTSLVAGYDGAADVPEAVVAGIAGSALLRLGTITTVLGAFYAVRDPTALVWVGYTAIVLAETGQMVYRLHSREAAAAPSD